MAFGGRSGTKSNGYNCVGVEEAYLNAIDTQIGVAAVDYLGGCKTHRYSRLETTSNMVGVAIVPGSIK
jgi:hypothetical protein